MELPKIKKFERGGGMLDGIKSKLGFADASNERYDEEFYDEYGDDFGDYNDEFAEYGDKYDEDAPASRYDPYAPVTTRPARSGSRPSRSSASSASSSDFPKLVSIDDVRAHTQVPDSLRRDPLPPRRVSGTSGGFRGERTVVDVTMPAPSSPAHTAAMKRERSEGLDSLFTSTAADESTASPSSALAGLPSFGTASASEASASAAKKSASAVASAAPASAGSPDSFGSFGKPAASAQGASRSISVLKPASYGEVEHVVKILKAGDAAVLALRNTPDQLSKRILDFSFGVSAALDANVECVGDKVFAITCGSELSQAERAALRNQGVL